MRMIYVSTGPVAVNFFFSHTFAMDKERTTVPLDLNFTYARMQKAIARNIHCNAPE